MLKLNSSLNEKFQELFDEVIEKGELSEREKVVSIITASTLLGERESLKNAIVMAKKLGLTNNELGQISAIALVVNSQKLNQSTGNEVNQTSNQNKSICCS